MENSTTTKVSRGERLLNKFVGQRVISPGGRDFLIAALDPFHDSELKNLGGYPDLNTSPSVIRLVKKSQTISAPAGLPVGSNWDCLIVNWPWLDPLFCNIYTRTGNVLLTRVTAAPFIVGGIQAFTGQSGVGLGPYNPPSATPPIFLDSEFSQGSTRLIGAGWEVHNTTATIQKQGSVIVGRSVNNRAMPQAFSAVAGVTGVQSTFVTASMRSPPGDPDTALKYPGARQWKAEDGCYVVTGFTGIENNPFPANYCQPMIVQRDDICNSVNSFALSGGLTNVIIPQIQVDAGPPVTSTQFPTKIYPVNTSYAYFTGLSAATTLTLNANFYVESFPDVSENAILTMATPSTDYDAAALEIYSHAMSNTPCGVPVAENGLGDWFMRTMDSVAPMLGALGPVGAVIGAGAKAITGSYIAHQDSGKGGGKGGMLAAPSSTESPVQKNPKIVTRRPATRGTNSPDGDVVMKAPGNGTSRKAKKKRAKRNAHNKGVFNAPGNTARPRKGGK